MAPCPPSLMIAVILKRIGPSLLSTTSWPQYAQKFALRRFGLWQLGQRICWASAIDVLVIGGAALAMTNSCGSVAYGRGSGKHTDRSDHVSGGIYVERRPEVACGE